MNYRLSLLLTSCLLLLIAGSPRSQAAGSPHAGQSLFGFTNLWTVHLTLTPADWQLLGSRGVVKRNSGGGGAWEGFLRGVFGSEPSAGSPAPDGNSRYPWTQCTFSSAGQTFTNVAVRMKGVSSVARAPNGYKRPLKLDFNRGAKGRRFLDVEEVYLNNNVNDATQLREVLAYELFRRAGLPAPRTAFAQVYLTIPGRVTQQHLGLYTLVEAVEEEFLQRTFGSSDGLLLKPEMMQGIPYLGDDWDNYTARYQPKGDTAPADTARFIEFVNFIRTASPEQFTHGITNYLEPEPFLRFVALNSILANVDSFIGNGHNYYLFLGSASRRATFIPWDLNEAFGLHPVSGPSRFQMQTSILRPNADPNPLVERFLNDPTFGARYRALCGELLTNVFVPDRLVADLERLATVTQPVVWAETKRARADFERTVLGISKPNQGAVSQPRFDREYAHLDFRPWSFPEQVEIDDLPLKDWIHGRHTNALEQLAGKVKARRSKPRLF
jgi:spore coat protein CotH